MKGVCFVGEGDKRSNMPGGRGWDAKLLWDIIPQEHFRCFNLGRLTVFLHLSNVAYTLNIGIMCFPEI